MIPPVATKGRRHHGPELRQAVARRSSPSTHLETWCNCFVKWFWANIGFLVNCGHVFSSDLTQTWKWYSGVLALAALQVVVAPNPYLERQWYMSAVVSRPCPRLRQATWYGLTWGHDDDDGGADENHHWLSLTSWNSIFGQFLANKVNNARPL